MENKKTMPFGKRFTVGNFTVIKYNKVLRKQEVAALIMETGIPNEAYNSLHDRQLPFIKVESSNCVWAIEFCCNTAIYRLINNALVDENANTSALALIFQMWFMDTIIPGDEEYQTAKAQAFKELLARKNMPDASDDGEKATVVTMNTAKKGGSDEV